MTENTNAQNETPGALAALKPALYLLPCPLAPDALERSLPPENIRVILGLKHFVVENTRSARRFLKACCRDIDINSLSITELNEHTPPQDVAPMLNPLLRNNQPIGVISEAGCPAVADPGSDLVAIAQRHGLEVIPMVGPSSIILGLMASGFNGQNFTFHGYLPVQGAPRTKVLKAMQANITHLGQTQIFIETPYRNNRLIEDLCQTLPGTLRLCVAADITGATQNIKTKTLAQWRNTKYDYAKTPTIFLLNS